MKLKLLYSLLLATSLVACTDDYTDWAAPQHNDPEASQSVSFTASAAPAINFADVTTDSVAIFAPTLTAEEGAKATYKLTLDETQTLNVDSKGRVLAEDLKAAVISLYGKRPVERTMSGAIIAYVDVNGQVVKSTLTTPVEVKVTLVAPVIESEYYFIGTTNNWTALDNTLKFNHSGQDVYDDPVFTIIVAAPLDATTGERVEQWFKIAPKSAYDGDAEHFWGSLLGGEVNGDESLTASLKEGGESFMQPATDGAKFYSITLNMMDYTMTIAPLSFEEFIYVPGNHQGWSPDSAPALQSANFDGIYTGYCYLDGNFKFTKARNWDGGEYNWNDFSEKGDLFFNDDGSNINITTPGFYQITANVQASSLSAVATNWGLIGSATAGGWDTDTPMTYDSSDESWSVTTDFVAGEFKFRANGGWDINFGGAMDNLTAGGDNIAVEAGNYTIKLYLTRSGSTKIHCVMTKN